jgi:hypothetical protein
VLTIFVIQTNCATVKNSKTDEILYVPITNEELTGTWINTDYSDTHQKLVVYHYGYYEGYGVVDRKYPIEKGTMTIVDKWTDSERNIWFKTYHRTSWIKTFYYQINKINSSGTIWEYYWDLDDFPTEAKIDANNPYHRNYRIYYRQ